LGEGQQVMRALIEAWLSAMTGLTGRHDPGRRAARHGIEAGSVAFAGRQRGFAVAGYDARMARGGSVPGVCAPCSRDLLDGLALGRMMAKLSDGLRPR
jgi:hypothetical protein